MTSWIRRCSLSMLLLGSVVFSGAMLLSRPAAAECGLHAGTCGAETYHSVGTHCDGETLYADYEVYTPYCLYDPGANEPCDSGYCADGYAYGCYDYSISYPIGGCY